MKHILATFLLFASLAGAQTNIAISNTALQTGVKAPGLNFGITLPYGANQMTKNLIRENPGFNPTIYRSNIYCGAGTNSTLCSDTQGQNFQSGFWPTGSPVVVLTGSAIGCTSTISTVSGSGFGLSSACSISSGDYILVSKTITSANAGSAWLPAYGWTTTPGGGSPTFTTNASVPPSANGDTYTQSLDVVATGSSDIAYVTAQADYGYNQKTASNQYFINLNGNYTLSYWAKSVSGASPNVTVSFGRLSNQPCLSACFLNFTADTPTGTWTKFTHTFTAAETGNPTSVLQVNFAFNGPEEVLIDNVFVGENTTGGNPTVFLNSIVSTLQTLKPGSLRMWDGQSLTNTMSNMLAGEFARSPSNFATYISGIGYYTFISYSIPEFLQLCQTIGTEAWISIPVTTTTAEATYLIDYLSGGSGTAGGAQRIAQGFSTPWTSISAIPKIHIELGNEEWNFGFEGGNLGLNLAGYGANAQTVFAAMKADSNYVSGKMSLVVGSQFATADKVQTIQNQLTANDEMAVGPYMFNGPYDFSSYNNIWQPLMSEALAYWAGSVPSAPVCAEQTGSYPNMCPSAAYLNTNPGCTPGVNCTYASYLGGGMTLNTTAETLTTSPKQLAIYEEQLGTGQSPVPSGQPNYTQANLDGLVPSVGAGVAYAEEMLLNLQNGIKTQNTFTFTQLYFGSAVSGVFSPLWGIAIDPALSGRKRPQFLAEQLVNAAVKATMLTTTQSPLCTIGTNCINVGTPNPTPTSAVTVNTIAMNSVPLVQSYAFTDGSGNYSLQLVNADVSNSQAVTFSGANAPTGTVTKTVLTSSAISDNNETSTVVSPVVTTVSSPSGMTLAPFSLTTLTWSTSTTPTISCPASVVAGGQITCTATGTVTWSVTGGGSINSSTGVYTAPTGVVAQNSMLGVNVMPNDVIFNTRIDNASFPLDSNSATKIATLPSTTLTIQPAWGISYADSGTATRNLLGYYNEVSYAGFPNQTSPSLLYRENGNKVGVFNNSSDHHSMIVNRSTGTFYETYNDYLSGYTRTCSDGSTANCNVQSATTYASTAYTFPSTASYNNGTDAAGLPLAPLVWHLDELKSGVINHAVRVTWNGQFNAGTFVWPASAYAGGTSGSPTTRTQLGDRLRLKSAYSITGACGTSPSVGSAGYYCTVGLTALAHYGMVIADTGTNNAIIVASDVESDPAVTAGLQMIAAAAIAPTNFEIVNEQALEVAANNYIVAPQSYATPLNQIVVSGSGASNTVNVAIQPIGVGSTLNASLYLEAGSYTVSLSPFFWVVPSSVSQTINYAIANNTCSSGSISGSALTVPTTGGCTLQITATSSYDSAAVTTRYVTVLAVGTSPANSVRIDSGKTTSTTDGNGNVWAADLGMIGQQAQNGSDNAWPQTNPYLTVYQSDDYSQQDLHYEMLVPNGNYQIQLLFGKLHEGGGCNNQPCGTWPTISSGYYPLLGYLPIWIETQGSMVSNTLDWGGQQGYLYTTPYSAFVPATVSNNLLEVGVGMYAPDSGPNYSGTNYGQSGNKYVTVNGISVLPDTTSAYLTVDPAANAPNMRVAAGGSTQPFYPVAHYFSGGTTTWAVGTNTTGLSASITSDGWGDGGMVLSLGSGTAKNGQVVTVIATNGSYISPAMAFYVSGASTTLTQNPLDPATSSSFSSVTAGMTQIASYTFGTNSGRNMQNATNLATAFSRYGIAGSTVINNQYQVFTPFTATANYVFDAADLNLAATATALTVGSINSGQIATNATYGPPGAPGQPNVIAFEVNAQIPGDQGEWPAIWLFKPTNNGPTGTQELSRPESDFEFFIGGYGFTSATQLTAFDHLTQAQLPNYAGTGIPQANTAGTFYSLLTGCSNQCYAPGTDFSAGFHLYQIVWTPDAIYKYIDGTLVKAISFKWTSPTGAQLLISHQVGNSSVSGFAPTSLGQFPSPMKIEHVSVLAK